MKLTRRQLQVGKLVAQGYSNLNIALRLKLTESCIKWHLSQAFRRLSIGNRVELTRFVLRYYKRR